MSQPSRHSRAYLVFWKTAFVVSLLLVCGALYYSTQKIDYVWRWYRLPQYFIAHQDIDVKTDIQGEVASIISEGAKSVVVVKSDSSNEQEKYTVPTKGLRVSKGDVVFVGDVLSRVQKTVPGIMIMATWMTLYISAISIVIGILLGMFTGLARLSENPFLRWWSITYIELIRGSPLLVQIYIWYFVLGTLINNLLGKAGIPEIPTLWFGIASMAVFSGAYVAEIVRAGIQSIHRGQREAARSLGMNSYQAMRHIILPQAFRRILPPLAGQFISLVKDSSLLGIISIRELTKASREVVTVSLQPFEIFFVCALLYLMLTFGLSLATNYLERKFIQA
ncbi:polar amino acid ABC transporter, inner membrane subunit [Desulfovibrio sp. X2]|uniref:amino acid ABC transporter permease n=1 Tax=Desulfovibrio sp. X2 TaxID=941449 RepID=UPI000358BA10|nr:amino acid ABC transporter permease [Desulfovibrio sp. X2]EPR37064.1 polar amino acid ABC transporter, inner membrane subunit [Desulfovibrio sp. X2]